MKNLSNDQKRTLGEPPSVEELISYCIKWLALNLHAKITITVIKRQGEYRTEEYDGRIKAGKREDK